MSRTPEQKADWINHKHGDLFDKLFGELDAITENVPPSHKAMRRIYEIVDTMAAKVAPLTPCKNKCAHCCYQSVMISSIEAEHISRETGTAMEQRQNQSFNTAEMRTRYSGVACPFLKRDQCSIYSIRPIACRLHFSLANDSWPCDITNNSGAQVPMFNFKPVHWALGLWYLTGGIIIADLREFFPTK